MSEVDLFTQLLTSKAVSGKLADIRHKTAELPQSTLSLTLIEINILLSIFSSDIVIFLIYTHRNDTIQPYQSSG